ncbi:Bleomycin hydrolase [Eumeta japonica]|uniref:Bleomycin hydrolase n=1 Tax=Eumeta variegata TaxID=151549 RepID=A0A4C1Z7G0_EUMVA|nr:Bleomycin hydrolase [Eumeta japonica]
MTSGKPLSFKLLNKFHNDYYADPKNELAQNVCTRFDPYEVCISKKRVDSTAHVYNIKVESEGKPVTNQENSGRCWLFAALNVMRLPFMKKYALEEFEFSQRTENKTENESSIDTDCKQERIRTNDDRLNLRCNSKLRISLVSTPNVNKRGSKPTTNNDELKLRSNSKLRMSLVSTPIVNNRGSEPTTNNNGLRL